MDIYTNCVTHDVAEQVYNRKTRKHDMSAIISKYIRRIPKPIMYIPNKLTGIKIS